MKDDKHPRSWSATEGLGEADALVLGAGALADGTGGAVALADGRGTVALADGAASGAPST